MFSSSTFSLPGRNLTIGEARKRGILDPNLTTFTDLRNSRQYSIQEAIDNQYLVATLDNMADQPATAAGMSSVLTPYFEYIHHQQLLSDVCLG